jgi:hypothetical protein
MHNFSSKKLRVVALVAIIPLFLGGCALPIPPARNAAKLDSTPAPIQDLTVIIWFGGDIPGCIEQSAAYSSTFRAAMTTRLPAIFEANEIRVTQTIVEKTPIKYKRLDSGDLALPLLEKIQTSHALVLIANEFSYQGNYQGLCGPGNDSVSVYFDARLWDVHKKRPVWSADPSLRLILNQPLLRSQLFAASLLTAMHKDGLIELKTNVPVDMIGKPISAEFIWAEDK